MYVLTHICKFILLIHLSYDFDNSASYYKLHTPVTSMILCHYVVDILCIRCLILCTAVCVGYVQLYLAAVAHAVLYCDSSCLLFTLNDLLSKYLGLSSMLHYC